MRSRRSWVVPSVIMALAAVILLAVVVRNGTDTETEQTLTAAAETTVPADHAMTAEEHAAMTGAAPSDGPCSDHYNLANMMWNATDADRMLDLGCPWPFPEGAVSLVGGAEEASIAAPFEARRYAELDQVLKDGPFGICSVKNLPLDPSAGVAGGFQFDVAAEACNQGVTSISLRAPEYATRAQRDAAAMASTARVRLALGRWMIELSGSDDDGADRLADALVDLGAYLVTATR